MGPTKRNNFGQRPMPWSNKKQVCLNSSGNHTHVEIQAKNSSEIFMFINWSSCKDRTSAFAKPVQCFDPSCTDVADKSNRNLYVLNIYVHNLYVHNLYVVTMLLNVTILTL